MESVSALVDYKAVGEDDNLDLFSLSRCGDREAGAPAEARKTPFFPRPRNSDAESRLYKDYGAPSKDKQARVMRLPRLVSHNVREEQGQSKSCRCARPPKYHK